MTDAKKSQKKRILAVSMMVGLGIAAFSTTAAQAAEYYFASELRVSEYERVYSGNRASSIGGSIYTGLGVGQQVFATYKPAPGYHVIASQTGANPGLASLSHQRYTNVHHYCYFDVYGNGGNAEVTCASRY